MANRSSALLQKKGVLAARGKEKRKGIIVSNHSDNVCGKEKEKVLAVDIIEAGGEEKGGVSSRHRYYQSVEGKGGVDDLPLGAEKGGCRGASRITQRKKRGKKSCLLPSRKGKGAKGAL